MTPRAKAPFIYWGRGAIDDKINVIGLLEAAEQLLGSGFAPRRTIYLAFGHDEEIGGPEGALHIARLLEERGIRPALVIDEGDPIAPPVIFEDDTRTFVHARG